jgi:ATP phosphoribosyltransferase
MHLKIGLPKGSLQEATFNLFGKAGWNFRVDARSYQPVVDDPEISAILIRPQEIPRYLRDGILDVGLTGKDWIEDNDAAGDVHEVAELTYSKATRNPMRIVLAAPADSPIESARDLQGKRIATEYVRLTERYLSHHAVRNATVEFSWGACEVKVPEGLADAIVVNTETGNSLRAHNLRIVDTLLTSTTRLVANHDSWADGEKRAKIENMAMLLQGALNAQALVGLKMNVACADLQNVLAQLPALRRPTISALSDDGWAAVEIIIDEKQARELIPNSSALVPKASSNTHSTKSCTEHSPRIHQRQDGPPVCNRRPILICLVRQDDRGGSESIRREQGVHELFGVEDPQVFGLFADADDLDGDAKFLPDRDDDAAARRCRPTWPARCPSPQRRPELLGLPDGVLAGRGV